ncbi:hypothetical protein Save01_04727 [Streptomyces avermitilis]|uniref:Uncharacterized protein n=1 Tax=Streptomyces avermitilis TaxID=33903 RepID=A0A4D4M3S3_STRAX|nr:hypothetical protein SAVMC3_69530 [Streptomyces avermitilis]GDY66337.1 hypothetical protein SAV14893_057300 [Streptomyces avermitilis]GDY73440.1 hypothetical protein SAV31267_029250 [Streptomyces avermitilis]GDY82529.1 hypothetical protein SAVCW2_17280 [Streptomyces avermitilis]
MCRNLPACAARTYGSASSRSGPLTLPAPAGLPVTGGTSQRQPGEGGDPAVRAPRAGPERAP